MNEYSLGVYVPGRPVDRLPADRVRAMVLAGSADPRERLIPRLRIAVWN